MVERAGPDAGAPTTGGTEATVAPAAIGARVGWGVLAIVTAGAALGLARLAVAFVTRDLTWRYVAEQSRPGLPWWYRLAGVWGGMEGSLLLFAVIVGVVAVVATRHRPAGITWAATATVGALVTIDVLLASPFRRLATPAVEGFGMNPILEHPAMTIHPPLLYLGLAAAGAAAVAGLGSGPAAARRGLLATVAVLTAAMTLGGAWSYLEQGWGGYWAWDPVENTSLAVWLAAVVALHAVPLVGERAARAAVVAPWALALAGATLVRSGTAPSIHGFAEQPDVGWALLALTVLTAAGLGIAVASASRPAAPAGGAADRRLVVVVLALAALAVVVAGTVLPALAELRSGRATAVRGEFFSRTVGPLALVATPFLVRQVVRRQPMATRIGHVGVVVLVIGIGVSSFDRTETAALPPGVVTAVARVRVANGGVRVVDVAGRDAVEATLTVGDDTLRPRIVTYPERGGRLAEVAARPGWGRDVLVVLERAADDGGAVVTVHTRPLVWTIWLGAATVALATAAQSRSRRRSRLRARRSSSVEPADVAVG